MEVFHDAVVHTIDLAATRAAVWNAVLDAHGQLGLPLTAKDEKTSELIFSHPNILQKIAGKRASTFLDCGGSVTGPRADTYRLTVTIGERIDSVAANHTRLHTVVEALARNSGVGSDPLHCSSTGELEKLIAAMVAARLN